MATPDGQVRRKTRLHGRGVTSSKPDIKKALKEFGAHLAAAIESLIHQGHLFCEVSNYTVPQIFTFLELANQREKGVAHQEFTSRLLAARGKDENVKEFYKRLS